MKTIKVKIVRNQSNYWVCRWQLPNGDWKQKSTRLTAVSKNRRKSVAFAHELEQKLNLRNYATHDIEWLEFCKLYYEEETKHLSRKTRDKFATVCRHIDRFEPVFFAAEITTSYISRFVVYLNGLEAGPSRITIHGYIRTLMASLKWGYQTEKINELPRYRVQKDVKRAMKNTKSKGRPITPSELDSMLSACEVVRPDDYLVWQDLIEGLYLSGLRLSEALILTTDRSGDFVFVDGLIPSYVIWKQKSGEEQSLPASPEFANFIGNREGRVFRVPTKRVDVASPIISSIGKVADIVVGRSSQGKVKYASAHDLRRSFASQWAERLSPQDLQLLMRHKSIQTTMDYYVELNMTSLGARIKAAVQ